MLTTSCYCPGSVCSSWQPLLELGHSANFSVYLLLSLVLNYDLLEKKVSKATAERSCC